MLFLEYINVDVANLYNYYSPMEELKSVTLPASIPANMVAYMLVGDGDFDGSMLPPGDVYVCTNDDPQCQSPYVGDVWIGLTFGKKWGDSYKNVKYNGIHYFKPSLYSVIAGYIEGYQNGTRAYMVLETSDGVDVTNQISVENLGIEYKIPFTMNSSGYATFCRDFDANFGFEEFAEDNADLKVYVASSVADTVVTLKEIGDKYIPSRTGTDNYDFHGVILKGTPGKTYYYTIGEQDYVSDEQITHADLMSANLLVGCPVETFILNRDEDEQAVFTLKNGKFHYLLDDMGEFSAQKAYLSLPRSQVQDIIDATRNHQTTAGAKLAMRFENADGTTETDGIEQVAAGLRDGESDVLYDLQGRRVETVPSHGIYVRNGRKVMIK